MLTPDARMLRLAFAAALLALSACGDAADPAPSTAVEPGTPAVAERSDTVVIDYVGTLEDGTEFDRGSRVEYPLEQFVPGFRDGIVGMAEGESKTLVIPPELAYGDQQVGPIPPNSTLTFDVTLHEVK